MLLVRDPLLPRTTRPSTSAESALPRLESVDDLRFQSVQRRKFDAAIRLYGQ